MLANSGANALICDDGDPAPLPAATRSLPIKSFVSTNAPTNGFETLDALLSADADPRYSQRDPPLIIYTSGTMGLPKGVTKGRRSPFFTDEQVAEYQRDVRHGRRSEVANPVVLVTMPMQVD